MSIPSKGVIETLALYPDDRALVSVARRSLRDLVDEIEALRSAVRTLNGTMVGDFFFATYLSPIELAAMRRALIDRSNPEGEA